MNDHRAYLTTMPIDDRLHSPCCDRRGRQRPHQHRQCCPLGSIWMADADPCGRPGRCFGDPGRDGRVAITAVLRAVQAASLDSWFGKAASSAELQLSTISDRRRVGTACDFQIATGLGVARHHPYYRAVTVDRTRQDVEPTQAAGRGPPQSRLLRSAAFVPVRTARPRRPCSAF
jgi:hypothetical protein